MLLLQLIPAPFFSNSQFTSNVLNDPSVFSYDTISLFEPDSISIDSANVTDVSINGANDGSIILDIISGGTTSYSYIWFGPNGFISTQANISFLFAGTYSLLITDANGCVFSQLFIINEPLCNITIDSTIVINETVYGANDGSITVYPSGGIQPYSYNWSSGQTTSFIDSLVPGLYTCLITDANGCSDFQTFTILEGDFLIYGCTDSLALNYDSLATIDDGSCIYNLYQEFIKSYDQSPNETAYDIIELTDGNILIAGFYNDTSSNNNDALLLKIDTNGLVIWSKTFGGTQGDDAFYSVIEDGGYLYSTGYSSSFTSDTVSNVYLVKTDLDGNISWSKTYGEAGCAGAYCGDIGYKIIKETSNSFLISGRFASAGSNLMAGYVLRVDSSGGLLNDYIIDGVGSEWLTSVSIAQNGDLLLVGTNKVSTWEPWLLRMQPNGATVFNKGYGTVTNFNGASDLVEFNNELYFLSDKAANICLTKLDASGDTLFVKEFGVSGSSYSKDILLSEDNNLYILGMIGNLTLLMKTDLNGDTLWTNYYQSLGSSLKLIEKDNHLYIIGGGLSNILLMKVPSDGTSNNCYKTSSSTFFTNSSDLIITNWSESNFSFTTTNTIYSITSNLAYIPDTICQTILISGCTDSNAINFDSTATIDDGSCTYLIYGCTDPLACNFDSTVTIDDGSCLTIYGCTDPLAFNYDSLATCNDGSCIAFIYGCTNPNAINFYAGANTDDGSCIYTGCTDSLALNYNPFATIDDGSCIYYSCSRTCAY